MPDENGFLTDVDKQFLRGEKEYDSKQGRYSRRQAIRERARAAFHDFSLLWDELEEDEYDKIFNPPEEESGGLEATIEDTFAFLYYGTLGGEQAMMVGDRTVTKPFDALLKSGVSKAAKRRRPGPSWKLVAEVDFDQSDVTVRGVTELHPDPVGLIEKAASSVDSLSESEARTVLTLFAVGDDLDLAGMEGQSPLEVYREQLDEREDGDD